MNDLERVFDAVLRADLASFTEKVFAHVAPTQQLQRTWHMRALANQLERCRRGEIRRLLITLPPRHMKSIFASISLPAFILGHDPTARIICASYAADLSAKLARDCRSVMTSPWYHRLFPGTRLSLERNAEADFMTTRRGFRYATSVGGSLTGRGGNWFILDDPMKADDAFSASKRLSTAAWFDNSVYTRLDNKRSDVIIVVMQRLHIDDLIGHILAKDDSWAHLDLPAIAEVDETIPLGRGEIYHRHVGDLLSPEREPLAVLEDLKRSLGLFNFSAQYQQRPVPVEGEIIKWSWFGFYDPLPRLNGLVYQSWDTAMKDGELSDYSVCTTWTVHDGKFLLLDLFRKRMLYPELKRMVVDLRQRHGASTVLIEDKGSGTMLIQELRYNLGCNVVPIDAQADKTLRASANSIPIEAGRVHLPRNAPWLAELQKEINQFPEGRHDDQVDSLTQFVGWMDRRENQPRVLKVKIGGI